MSSLELRLTDLDLSKVLFFEENVLSKLDKKKRLHLLNDYYFGKSSFSKSLSKYHVRIRAQEFYKYLPAINTNIKCPYDNSDMYSELPAKSRQDNWNKDIFCLKCNHKIFRSSFDSYGHEHRCNCEGCLEKRAIEKERFQSTVRKVNGAYSPIEYELLSLDMILDLAVVLQSSDAKSLYNIESLDNLEEVNRAYDFSILKYLANESILLPSENSSVGSIEINKDKGGYTYYQKQVNWNVNVIRPNTSDETVLNILKYPNIGLSLNLDPVDSHETYRKLVWLEMDKVIAYQFQDLSLLYEKDLDKEKMKSAVLRWLMNFTPAQVYSLIWRGVRRADNSRTRGVWGNYRYNQVDFVIKLVDEIIGYKDQNYEIKPYNYPSKYVEENLKSKIFFDQILLKPDWFFQKVPMEDEPNDLQVISTQSLSDMSKMCFSDLKLIPDIVEKAIYFSVEEYGIVVFSETDKLLFSNQLSIYQYFKNYDGVDWLNKAQSEFKIPHFFSLDFLLCLQQSLLNANVDHDS